MHKSTKAALISAFIFPGFGHFYVKNKLRGAVFVLFAVACLYVLMTYVLNIANEISERILSGQISLELSGLIAEITSQLNTSTGNFPNIASFLLLSCWVIAIIDSFIIGRKCPVSTKIK